MSKIHTFIATILVISISGCSSAPSRNYGDGKNLLLRNQSGAIFMAAETSSSESCTLLANALHNSNPDSQPNCTNEPISKDFAWMHAYIERGMNSMIYWKTRAECENSRENLKEIRFSIVRDCMSHSTKWW